MLIYSASVIKNINFVVTLLIVLLFGITVWSVYIYTAVKEDEEKRLAVRGIKLCLITIAILIVAWCLLPSSSAMDQIVRIASGVR